MEVSVKVLLWYEIHEHHNLIAQKVRLYVVVDMDESFRTMQLEDVLVAKNYILVEV